MTLQDSCQLQFLMFFVHQTLACLQIFIPVFSFDSARVTLD